MLKMNIFSNELEKKSQIVNEEKKEYEIIDKTLISYIMKEFPEVAEGIKESFNNLKETLEISIDIIEDKSSEVIKNNRDFELSGKYRDNAIKVHNISSAINDYIGWMNTEVEKNLRNIKNVVNDAETQEEVIEKLESIDGINYIFEDFTMKEPRGFIIDNHIVEVEDWEDMIVKTADVLIKHYKNNVKEEEDYISPVIKKSKQNDYRDTIIDLLEEHNMSLNKYRIILK